MTRYRRWIIYWRFIIQEQRFGWSLDHIDDVHYQETEGTALVTKFAIYDLSRTVGHN